MPMYEEMKQRDADFYERLSKAGFMLDFGDDESGLFMKYLRRGSGYYIDVGASELVADGKIKLKSGVEVERIKEHSLVFSDGSELPADLIVFATGYGSMNGWAAQLISQEVADKVGKCWGLGSRHAQGPGPVGGRAAQHVEAHASGGAVVPWRQPAPVAPLLAVPLAAVEGADGGNPHAGLRHGAGASFELMGRRPSPLKGGEGIHRRPAYCFFSQLIIQGVPN